MMLTPSGGSIRDKVLRVGHLGSMDIEDYQKLIDGLKEVMGL